MSIRFTPRRVSVHPRHPADDVSRPAVDDAAVRGLRDGGGIERALPVSARAGRQRPERRVRPADADGLRLGPSARRRRGRPRRRRDRFDRGHGDALRRHSARPRLDVDDHQRDRHHPAGALHRRRADARASPREALGHGPERHPEGIRRARHLHLSAAPSLRIVTDIFAFCERELPNWNTISISGYHIREAGSTAVQEVAFTFANAIAYVQAAIDAGLDVNQFGQRLSFFFNAHNDFLEEVAKFRAARRLWARIMRDRFHATNPRAQQLRFHTQTAGSTLTAQQPDNNIVRVALQALAAVLGGTQSLHCNGRDEALALPTEESARIALRTQQIIAAESGVANTVDPVAGSYAIEALTNEIEAGRRRHPRAHRARRRHARGHRGRASFSARFRSRPIARSSPSTPAKRSSSASTGSWTTARATDRRRFGVDPEVERRQIERVRAVRASRSAGAWRPRWPRQPRGGTAATSCRRSSPPWKPAPPSAKFQTRCARCSASSRKRRRSDLTPRKRRSFPVESTPDHRLRRVVGAGRRPWTT